MRSILREFRHYRICQFSGKQRHRFTSFWLKYPPMTFHFYSLSFPFFIFVSPEKKRNATTIRRAVVIYKMTKIPLHWRAFLSTSLLPESHGSCRGRAPLIGHGQEGQFGHHWKWRQQEQLFFWVACCRGKRVVILLVVVFTLLEWWSGVCSRSFPLPTGSFLTWKTHSYIYWCWRAVLRCG